MTPELIKSLKKSTPDYVFKRAMELEKTQGIFKLPFNKLLETLKSDDKIGDYVKNMLSNLGKKTEWVEQFYVSWTLNLSKI